MQNVTACIRARRSVRTYNGIPLKEEDMEKLRSFAQTVRNPYEIPVSFVWMPAKENGLGCPVIVGEHLYVGGKIPRVPNADVALGYSFETLLLYAQSIGLGSVWLGGMFRREVFEKAASLGAQEIMPCVSPIGYPAEKMSLRESLMRKGIRASSRAPFETLFFDTTPDTPLEKEKAGAIASPLEMVRLAPSAVNRQPWRAVFVKDTLHFYQKTTRSQGANAPWDLHKIDMGIALCHFHLAAQEEGVRATFVQNDPQIDTPAEWEYIASFSIG